MTANILMQPVTSAGLSPVAPETSAAPEEGFAMALQAASLSGAPPGPEPPPIALVAEEGVASIEPNALTLLPDFLPLNPTVQTSTEEFALGESFELAEPNLDAEVETETTPEGPDLVNGMWAMAEAMGNTFNVQAVPATPIVSQEAPVAPEAIDALSGPEIKRMTSRSFSELTTNEPLTEATVPAVESTPKSAVPAVETQPLTTELEATDRMPELPAATPNPTNAPETVATAKPKDGPKVESVPAAPKPTERAPSTDTGLQKGKPEVRSTADMARQLITDAPENVKVQVQVQATEAVKPAFDSNTEQPMTSASTTSASSTQPIINEKVDAKVAPTQSLEVNETTATVEVKATTGKTTVEPTEVVKTVGQELEADEKIEVTDQVSVDSDNAAPAPSSSTTTTSKEVTGSAAPTEAKTNTSNIDKVHLVRQVADRMEMLMAARPKDGVTVHLEPADLGRITVLVRSIGNQIEASIDSQHESVRNALEQSRPHLLLALEQRGMQVGNLQFGSSRNNENSQGFGSNPWQQSNQQNGHNGNAERQFGQHRGFGGNFGNQTTSPEAVSASRFSSGAQGVNLWL